MKELIKNNQGQIALVVLVISAVVMTIGLSMSKRSVVETNITTDEELLKQAFNAAESGIDYFLSTGQNSFSSSDNKSSANVVSSSIGGGANLIDMGELTKSNNVAFFWLVGHDSNGSIDMTQKYNGTMLTVCVDDSYVGSLKIDYFYYQSDYKAQRVGFNVAVDNKVSNYSNIPANPVTGCAGVANSRGIDLGSLPFVSSGATPLLLAVKPIGGDTNIKIQGDNLFPVQGVEIRSLGTAGDVGGSGPKVNRNLRVVDKYFVPEFMIDAITSTGNVNAN